MVVAVDGLGVLLWKMMVNLFFHLQGEAVWNLTDPTEWEVQFDVIPDGQYHVYYVPLFPFKLTSPEVQLNLTQMRLNPVWGASNGQAVKIDWIRVVRGGVLDFSCEK